MTDQKTEYAEAIAELGKLTGSLLERIEREQGASEALPVTAELSHALASFRRAERVALRARGGKVDTR